MARHPTLLLAAAVAAASCAAPEPKMDFPDEETKRWSQGKSGGQESRVAPLPPVPPEPVLVGDPVSATAALVASVAGEKLPPKDAAYVAIAAPSAPGGGLASAVLGAVRIEGAAPTRSKGPELTRCGDDRLLAQVALSAAPPAGPAGSLGTLVLVPASLGPVAVAAPSEADEKAAAAAAKKYAEHRGAHLAYVRAVQADLDPALEALAGLTRDASRQDCGLAVAVERTLVDDDGQRLSTRESTACLDDARARFCAETDDRTRCDPSQLDLAGVSAVAPVPIAAAGLAGGGSIVIEEEQTGESRTRSVVLLRGADVRDLGSVTFFTGDAETGTCR